MKECVVCKKVLESNCFYPRNRACKECINKKRTIFYKNNTEMFAERARKYYKKNRETIIEKVKSKYNYEQKREYDKAYKRKFSVVVRNLFLWAKYRTSGKYPGKYKTYKNVKLKCTVEEFTKYAEKSNQLKKVYEKWVENNYSRKFTPTIDRIDITKDYSIDNIQFLSNSDNVKKYFKKDVLSLRARGQCKSESGRQS